MIQHFDETSLDRAIATGVTVVDFWASWCGPCRIVGPVIEQLAVDFDGRAVVGKVDVDEQSDLAARFGIQSIPTVIIFKDSTPVDVLVGVRDSAEYTAAIEAHL